MGQAKNWTPAEDEYLETKWATPTSIPAIAKKLGRSINGVKLRAGRLGLGAKLAAGDWISFNALHKALNGSVAGGYYKKSWVENRGLRISQVKVENNKFDVVYLIDFWRWAEKNMAFLDFSKMQPQLLGPEPKWVEQKRKDDAAVKMAARRRVQWSDRENARLKSLVCQGKNYQEIAQELHRSKNAIAYRVKALKIANPKKQPPHSSAWSKAQYLMLRQLVMMGKPWVLIAQEIGKGEKACRSKAFSFWGTENIDKLRGGLISQNTAKFERLMNK